MSTPFSIDLWKAGRRVTTRDGREVKQLTEFDCKGECLVGVIDGFDLTSWDIEGKFILGETTRRDLIHPDEDVVVEVGNTGNVYFNDLPVGRCNIIPPGKYKLVKID